MVLTLCFSKPGTKVPGSRSDAFLHCFKCAAKAKNNQLMQANASLQTDNQELQQKYAQKAQYVSSLLKFTFEVEIAACSLSSVFAEAVVC